MTESSELGDVTEGPCDDIIAPLVSRPRYDGISVETQDRIEQKYHIREKLGRGQYGVVYAATTKKDNGPIRHVAIKIALPECEQFLRDEVEVLTGRDLPPEIAVSCHEYCIDDQDVQPYFVMQHLTGRPVDEYADELSDLDRKLYLVQKLFRDLWTFHDVANVVLSDIKPAHILVERDFVRKFLDFGACKDNRRSRGRSESSKSICTRKYTVPSVAAGKSTNKLTDISSMAGVAFRILTRQLPRFGASESAAATTLSSCGVPDSITQILIQAMRDPHHEKNLPRYKSARDVASALDDAIRTHSLNGILAPIILEHESELQKSMLDHESKLSRTVSKARISVAGLLLVCVATLFGSWYWMQEQRLRIATDVRAEINSELGSEFARHHGTVSGILLAESQHATVNWRLENAYISRQHAKLVTLSDDVTDSRNKGDLKSASESLAKLLETSLKLVAENDRANTIAVNLDRLVQFTRSLPASLMNRLKDAGLQELNGVILGADEARKLWNEKEWDKAERKIGEATGLLTSLLESVANDEESHLVESVKQAEADVLKQHVRRLQLEVTGLDGHIDKLGKLHADELAEKKRETHEVLVQLKNAKAQINELSQERDQFLKTQSDPTMETVSVFGLITGITLALFGVVRHRRRETQVIDFEENSSPEFPTDEPAIDGPEATGQFGDDKWCSYCNKSVPEQRWGTHSGECSGRIPCRFCGKPIPKSLKGIKKHERHECKKRPAIPDHPAMTGTALLDSNLNS